MRGKIYIYKDSAGGIDGRDGPDIFKNLYILLQILYSRVLIVCKIISVFFHLVEIDMYAA